MELDSQPVLKSEIDKAIADDLSGRKTLKLLISQPHRYSIADLSNSYSIYKNCGFFRHCHVIALIMLSKNAEIGKAMFRENAANYGPSTYRLAIIFRNDGKIDEYRHQLDLACASGNTFALIERSRFAYQEKEINILDFIARYTKYSILTLIAVIRDPDDERSLRDY